MVESEREIKIVHVFSLGVRHYNTNETIQSNFSRQVLEGLE